MAVDRSTFWRTIDDAEVAALLVDALYLPDVPRDRIHSAKATLAPWAGPTRRVPFSLIRVTARVSE